MVLQTMAMHSGCPALSINDWPARRQALEAPLSFRQIREATSSHVHLMRKRYLRRLSQDQQEDQCLEPAAPLLLQFPHWARVFPNANVVVTHADENYLKMQWRLLGYRQVPTMLKICPVSFSRVISAPEFRRHLVGSTHGEAIRDTEVVVRFTVAALRSTDVRCRFDAGATARVPSDRSLEALFQHLNESRSNLY